MAKADLLTWVRKHCGPLLPEHCNKPTATQTPTQQNDYDYFNTQVTSAATCLAALRARSPPLSHSDIAEAYAQYLL